jgi:hypothetical protein
MMGRQGEEEDASSYWMTVKKRKEKKRKEKVLELKRGNTGSRSLENSLGSKRPLT